MSHSLTVRPIPVASKVPSGENDSDDKTHCHSPCWRVPTCCLVAMSHSLTVLPLPMASRVPSGENESGPTDSPLGVVKCTLSAGEDDA